MTESPGQDSRDAAERFGQAIEDAKDKAGDALDALQGDAPAERTSPDDESGAGGDININIHQ